MYEHSQQEMKDIIMMMECLTRSKILQIRVQRI